jgi:hypothetical protein
MNSCVKAIQMLPHMLDYMKAAFLHRGKVLIIEKDAAS